MRFNSLRFGKAMSAALFVLLLSVVGMKNVLAQNQVATLQHNDTITRVFYGSNAFVSAHNAAVAGDIITLSSGTFNSVNISKSIIIRGAGCAYDSITNMLPTFISGNFDIDFGDCSACNAAIEGVKFIGVINMGSSSNNYIAHYANYISFTKCFINSIRNCYNHIRYSNQFVDCIINSFSSINFTGTSIVNSVVKFTEYSHNDINNCTSIYNSIILFDNGLSINNLIAYNSIIATISEHAVSNCTFLNTIGIQTGETSLFDGQTTQNVMTSMLPT